MKEIIINLEIEKRGFASCRNCKFFFKLKLNKTKRWFCEWWKDFEDIDPECLICPHYEFNHPPCDPSDWDVDGSLDLWVSTWKKL